MGFQFQSLEIPEVILIEGGAFEDQRGFLIEVYKRSEFSAIGISDFFVQDNYSHSVRGVLRGLHYQKHPKAQAKLVMVLRGEIFDVSVDLRKGAPTFGRWVGVALSSQRRQLLYVPGGFAHGFCVLSGNADVLYKATAEYAPELDRGVIWSDPEIGIPWPIREAIVSPRDALLPPLRQADNNFTYEAGR
jgi:dTDP-4-dehydrorhamnose 3,5-epimerase